MSIKKRFAALLSFLAVFCVCSLLIGLSTATAQDLEILLAELGGVQMIGIPQPPPAPGLLAGKVVLRTAPGNKLVTFENISVTGNVHQTWLPGAFGGPPGPTPYVDSPGWGQLPPEWIAADSHILVSPSMVAGGAGGSHGGIGEANDLGNQAGGNESLPLLGGVAPAVTGFGDITMAAETDAFFVGPEFQTNEIDFAYLVTQDDGTIGDDVFLTVGVLGAGIVDSGQPGGASFGFNGNRPVPIPVPFPEPSTGTLTIFALAAVTYLRRRI